MMWEPRETRPRREKRQVNEIQLARELALLLAGSLALNVLLLIVIWKK